MRKLSFSCSPFYPPILRHGDSHRSQLQIHWASAQGHAQQYSGKSRREHCFISWQRIVSVNAQLDGLPAHGGFHSRIRLLFEHIKSVQSAFFIPLSTSLRRFRPKIKTKDFLTSAHLAVSIFFFSLFSLFFLSSTLSVSDG